MILGSGYYGPNIQIEIEDKMSKNKDKIKREMREHPERFDYGDIPDLDAVSKQHQKDLRAIAPEWVKKRLAKRKGKPSPKLSK